MTAPPTDLPLSDEQLRRIAANILVTDARIASNDLAGISENLDVAAAEAGVDLDMDALLTDGEAGEDTLDTILEAVAEHIAKAVITVAWPDSDVRVVDEPKEDA